MAVIRLERDARFLADLGAQLAYLAEHGDLVWIDRLEEDLAEAEALLQVFPDAGTEVRRPRRRAVRRLRLRRAPYVIWYVRPRSSVVILMRLFHVRQRAATPRS